MTRRRSGRLVLLGVVALHLIADSALSPFHPQLFRELFGITDLAATGTYVWACRAAAVVALPLWGLAARRWPAHRLVVAGLSAAAVLDVALAVTPTYAAFTAVSVALVAATMALALAYPALVALGDGADRLPQVRAFAVVTHLATVVATLIGAGVVAMPEPRLGLAAFAALDVALAVACHRVLGRRRATAAAPVAAPAAAPAAAPRPGGSPVWRGVALVAAVVFAVEVGRAVVRPFFTLYAEHAGAAPAVAAVLFLLPSLAALAVLPAARAAHRRLGPALLPASCAVAAAGLLVQAADPRPAVVAAGRVLFGAGLGLGQVALDLRVFAATGTRGPAYAVVESAGTVALLVSPVAATAAAERALPAPLLAGAAVFALLAVTGAAGRRRPSPLPTVVREESRVPEPAR